MQSPYDILLVNESTLVTDDQLAQIAKACDTQLKQHASYWWELSTMDVRPSKERDPEHYNIVIRDESTYEGAAGWHTDDATGIHGEVAAGTYLNYGGQILTGENAVSTVVSHEVLELYVDRSANVWRDSAMGWLMIQEICDPVQSEYYVAEDVAVSNFVTPAFFDPTPYYSTYDHMGLLTGPFTCAEGGYFVWMQGGREYNYFGSRVPEWKKQLKLQEASRIQRIKKAERLFKTD